MTQKFEYTVLELIDSAWRNVKSLPLNLGGITGAGGGVGGPPGGFIGWLPQTRVAYDTTEAATLFTPASGMSLLDNLNHIRYRLNILESGGSITIVDDNQLDTYYDTTHLHFSGAGVSVLDLGGGHVQAIITATGSGGGGTPLTVEEYDGSPVVTNVDRIIFSGLMVTNLGSGDALVSSTASGSSEIGQVYYLSGTIIDLLEDAAYMRSLSTVKDLAGVQTGTASSLGSGESKHLIFATIPTSPNAQTISKGTFRFYITTKQNSGTRVMYVRMKLYKQNSSGTQTLLVTSSDSPALTASYVTYELTVVGGPFTLDQTDRLVAKIYYYGESSGTNASVSSQFANTDGERIEIPTFTKVSDYAADTGWIPVSEVWTRTGNYTFTVTGDLTAKYRKGTKVRYDDDNNAGGGSYEYGVVASSSHSAGTTTVTLITNSDYAMASATITRTYISYIENPEGFPHTFNFTPVWASGVTIGNATVAGKWSVQGNFLHGNVTFKFPAASPTCAITGTITLTPPLALNAIMIQYTTVGSAACVDWGTALYMGECVVSAAGDLELRVINASATYATWTGTSSTVPFTWNVDDLFTMSFDYIL